MWLTGRVQLGRWFADKLVSIMDPIGREEDQLINPPE